ncbi:MAG: PLP-dependent aminotransferase family protein [Candidatus Melainabacteria bacterium]|nr:MAG: PLP-dependent aminotransferase family protein [Candidatus Melainabacteria bacterium]
MALISAIESGRLPPNSPLQPSRVMAESLGVSRDTVLRAYRHLRALGFTETGSTRGTFVANLERKSLKPVLNSLVLDHLFERISPYGKSMTERAAFHPISPDFHALNYGGVPKEALPLNRWRELIRNRCEPSAFKNLKYDMEPLGRPELREALSAYLNRAKSIPCTEYDIAIFNISFAAVALLSRLLLNDGDLLAIEDPGFGGVKNVANYHDIETLTIPVDQHGLVVEELYKSKRKIKLVYVTPDHHDPTGITMTSSRREALLLWASKSDAWIIEDDYDGFFNYGKRLPPSLKSMDTEGRVIYLSTFWQVLYPLTTICFLVVPPLLMPILEQSKIQTEGVSETMIQLVLADILKDGFLQKHVRKLEKSFKAKRSLLMYELKMAFGPDIEIQSESGGITCLFRYQKKSEKDVLKAANLANLPIICTSGHYLGSKNEGEFLAYFPGLSKNPDEVRAMVREFARLLMG